MKKTTRIILAGMVLGAICFSPTGVSAQSSNLRIGGFGSWTYGQTNRNLYATGTPEGEYENTDAGLNLSARTSDRVNVFMQFHWAQHAGDDHIEVDFAVAEYVVSDQMRFRVGRVKHPFGLYTEIHNVGTLRPFLNLPLGMYAGSGLISEGFRGAAFAGSFSNASDWSLEYDVYGGKLDALHLPLPEPEHDDAEAEAAHEHTESLPIRDMVGARATVGTPVTGLRLMLSAYTGMALEEEVEARQKTWATSLEYESGSVGLRSEYAHLSRGDAVTAEAGYAEFSHRLTSRWQWTARWEWGSTNHLEGAHHDDAEADLPASLSEHDDVGVGLNYWFSPSFVLKASLHNVTGNRFATPFGEEGPPADFDFNTLNADTRLFQVGAQFVF